ncbi:MAG: hypothetical protein ACR2F0_07790 [Chthoniobacterales bacterium]
MKIDMHVHMAGNAVPCSGGWLRLHGKHRWLARFMVRQLGLPAAVLTPAVARAYRRRKYRAGGERRAGRWSAV